MIICIVNSFELKHYSIIIKNKMYFHHIQNQNVFSLKIDRVMWESLTVITKIFSFTKSNITKFMF